MENWYTNFSVDTDDDVDNVIPLLNDEEIKQNEEEVFRICNKLREKRNRNGNFGVKRISLRKYLEKVNRKIGKSKKNLIMRKKFERNTRRNFLCLGREEKMKNRTANASASFPIVWRNEIMFYKCSFYSLSKSSSLFVNMDFPMSQNALYPEFPSSGMSSSYIHSFPSSLPSPPSPPYSYPTPVKHSSVYNYVYSDSLPSPPGTPLDLLFSVTESTTSSILRPLN
jgi:hypothetical protein